MNKFLRRSKKTQGRKDGRMNWCPYKQNQDLLEDAASCWHSLLSVREKADRSFQYAWGNQWGDRVRNPKGYGTITEEELIRSQGNQPIKNNMIAPIMNNIEGQFKSAPPKTIVSARNQHNSKAGEMMSVAIEYVQDLNDVDTLDTECLMASLCSGIKMQRIEYGWNEDKYMSDVWLYNVDYDRCFFNTDIKDSRAWDLRIIGELFDATLPDIKARFINSRPANERKRMEEYIESIYDNSRSIDREYTDHRALSDKNRMDNVNFYQPSQTNMHRVILVWRKEYRDALFVHDTLKGSTDFVEDNAYWRSKFSSENEQRIRMAMVQGIPEEEVMLIEYEPKTEVYWQYYYMSPYGDILETGKSPFWHHSHNYALTLYPLRNGTLFNYVEQFIDQQRSINRTFMQMDFIRGSSARGLLVVNEDAMSGMSRDEIIDEYSRYNGVFFVKLKPGQSVQNVLHQYNTSAVAAGDFELLNLQMKLINDIAGISTAMQGHEAKSGVSAAMYNMQTQNSSINVHGLFSSFTAFRRKRDYKLMMTIQQYYNERKYIDIAGSDYQEESKWYDPDVVKNAMLYSRVTEGGNNPAYKDFQNNFLMQLYQQKGIDLMTMLEQSSYPWAQRLIETLKRKENEAMEQQQQMAQMQGIPPEQMQQLENAAPNADLYRLMNNDALQSPDDGVVQRPQPKQPQQL